jgi:hypothetical protein
MTNDDLERLRRCEKKIVTINCSDGELLKAKILHVDDEYRDVVFGLISTNLPENYKALGAAYALNWDDILDFHEDAN